MKQARPNRPLIIAAIGVTCLTWPAAAIIWFSKHELAFAVSIFLGGLSLGPCLAAYAIVRTPRKQTLRRAVLWAGGLSIAALSLLGAMNLDLEGFFMLLLSGTVGVAIGHTMVTLVIGPLVFGRFLCGWGCWRSMVLESLPLGKGAGRHQRNRLARLRYLQLGLSGAFYSGKLGVC